MNIIDYIKGNRKGKAANRLEREAMNDPFLQDALDGYNSSAGNHAKDIDELQARIKELSQQKSKKPWFIAKKEWLIAASFAVLVVGITFFMIMKKDSSSQLAMQHDAHNIKSIDTFNLVLPAIEVENSPLLAQAFHLKINIEDEKGVATQEDFRESIEDLYYYTPQPLSEEMALKKMSRDTSLLAMDMQASNQKLKETLGTMESMSSMNGEIITVRGNRNDGQQVIVDGVRMRSESSTKNKSFNKTKNKDSFEEYIMSRFNRNICPDFKGKVTVTISVDENNIPKNTEIKGNPCEEFNSMLDFILEEIKIRNMAGKKIKLDFHFD